MKRNLNSLNALIAKFTDNKNRKLSSEERFILLDEILFFANKMQATPFINKETKDVKVLNARSAQLRASRRVYSKGTTFIRARKLDAILEKPILQDFWEPPSQYAKKFRLNTSGEAVLYMTSDTLTAKRETKIGDNEIYNLSFYRAENSIEVTEFGFPLTGGRTKIERTIEKFLHNLLIAKGETFYDVSNFIAKRYFSLSKDGWVYPSIANNHKGENICLSIKSKKKLNLIGAFAFCNDIPIVQYDLTNPDDIKMSAFEKASEHWQDFATNSKVFGKISSTGDSSPIFIVKQIDQLD